MASNRGKSAAAQSTQHAAHILKTEGTLGLVKRIVRRLKRKPLRRGGYAVALSLDQPVRVPVPTIDVEVYQIQATGNNDLEMLREMLLKCGIHGVRTGDISQRLIEGQRCYVAKSEDRIVSGYWVLEGEFGDDILGRRFKLTDNELYYEGAFTVPEFRGKGIMPQLVTQATNDIKAHSQHKTRAWAFIEASNKASLRSTAKMGFRQVGRVGFVEIVGVRFHYIVGRDVLPGTTQRFFVERR